MKNIKWKIDLTQSKIAFNVRKLMITTIHGSFKTFTGELETESEKFESLKNIQFRALIDSVKTDDEKRDEHLKSADFFDLDRYPYFSFKANNYTIKDRQLQGELTIRNITRPVILDAEFFGTSANENGEISPGLIISGKV